MKRREGEKREKEEEEDEDEVDFVKELRSFELWRGVIGECVGTYFLLFFTSIVMTAENKSQIEKSVPIGLSMMFLTFVFLPVSGAHLNPALTLTMMVLRKVSPVRALFYTGAQCGGAISGSGTVAGILGLKTQLQPSPISSLGPEFILTFLISLVYFHGIEQDQFSGSIMIGASHLTVLSSAQYWVNPVQAFGPAFLTNQFRNHWVIWLGTVLGALGGGVSYTFIFKNNPSKQSRGQSSLAEPTNEDDDVEKMSLFQLQPKNPVLVAKPELLPPKSKGLENYHEPSNKPTINSSLLFSPPRYKRTRTTPHNKYKNMDLCSYNLKQERQERSLTDDELHRTSRQYRENKPSQSLEQFSGSSSGYYSWDRADAYDTEDDLCTAEMCDQSRKFRRFHSQDNPSKNVNNINSVNSVNHRQRMRLERKPSKRRVHQFQKSISTSY